MLMSTEDPMETLNDFPDKLTLNLSEVFHLFSSWWIIVDDTNGKEILVTMGPNEERKSVMDSLFAITHWSWDTFMLYRREQGTLIGHSEPALTWT